MCRPELFSFRSHDIPLPRCESAAATGQEKVANLTRGSRSNRVQPQVAKAGGGMQFEMMHLSMLERQRDLFDVRVAQTRENWLREVFGEPITFMHRTEQFHYVPEPDKTLDVRPLIAGRIGRRIVVTENEPPEQGLHERQRDSWLAAEVFIDPRHHADGQKVAFQYRDDVGKPFAIFLSLASHINTNSVPAHHYLLEVAPITDPQTFWDFVEQNRGGVTAVEFDLVTPNMFDGPEHMAEEMKDLRDKERVRKLKLQYENPDSLELETPRIRTIVDYATKGGGNIKAKARGKKSYNSKRKVKTVPIEGPESAATKSTMEVVLQAVKALIFGQ